MPVRKTTYDEKRWPKAVGPGPGHSPSDEVPYLGETAIYAAPASTSIARVSRAHLYSRDLMIGEGMGDCIPPGVYRRVEPEFLGWIAWSVKKALDNPQITRETLSEAIIFFYDVRDAAECRAAEEPVEGVWDHYQKPVPFDPLGPSTLWEIYGLKRCIGKPVRFQKPEGE
jgi:hypothetical protein